ncbi:uncharacterized protein LOC114763145 [Neltuma alba]|uniref:uncharacterized protein LOC114763145 n=1 Tax=Neltuma alba TaxID=207710 RepID=UPI0010A4BC24|nr:uncharacterized protein LOC114763145 [Prosopis alba]
MCDFLASNSIANSVATARRLAFLNLRPRNELKPRFHAPFCVNSFNASYLDPADDKNGDAQFLKSASVANGRSRRMGSKNYRSYDELEFEDKGEKIFGLERNRVDGDAVNFPIPGSSARDPANNLGFRDDTTASSGSEDFVELNSGSNVDERSRKEENSSREEDLVPVQSDTDGVDLEKDEKFNVKLGIRRAKQVIRRSTLLAKQVISIRSAISLGFVSQLWVDTTSWVVLFVEVRPNLLSGESERFLLEDISQVGDVVLVQDESVVENEYRMVGLETLVGYKVVTPSQQNIGKVRGYTFNINSGAVEELELDSFGLSIIPSSLVTTYSLMIEDVLEVLSDAVVVHEAAASRIQRLSKGLLGNQNVGTLDDVEEYYSDSETERSATATSDYASRSRRSFRRKKGSPRDWDTEEDLELPMDYL